MRRSGVTSIREALRLVPGVQVARIDSNKWAITASCHFLSPFLTYYRHFSPPIFIPAISP
ncbi:MAG: hypothetical protein ACREYF_10680 [Gammaproteobacteria bacterium]